MLAYRREALFMMPAQLGPIRRTPAATAVCRSARSSSTRPVSAKPEVSTTAKGTPQAPQARMTSTTWAAGTATRASSTGGSSEAAPGTWGKPSGLSAFGFTAERRPGKPP